MILSVTLENISAAVIRLDHKEQPVRRLVVSGWTILQHVNIAREVLRGI